MAIWNYRSGSTRVPQINIHSVRTESADGTRWALAQTRKRSLPDKMWDTVRVYILKHRVNGKVVVAGQVWEQADADAWTEHGLLPQ